MTGAEVQIPERRQKLNYESSMLSWFYLGSPWFKIPPCSPFHVQKTQIPWPTMFPFFVKKINPSTTPVDAKPVDKDKLVGWESQHLDFSLLRPLESLSRHSTDPWAETYGQSFRSSIWWQLSLGRGVGGAEEGVWGGEGRTFIFKA